MQIEVNSKPLLCFLYYGAETHHDCAAAVLAQLYSVIYCTLPRTLYIPVRDEGALEISQS